MSNNSQDARHAAGRDSQRRPTSTGYVSPLYQLLLSLAVACGLILLIFGTYEIVERAWLYHLETESLRTLHRMRGIITALAVGITVGWVVIRTSPALLAATAVEEDRASERDRDGRLRLFAHWFIAMRWITVLVASILAFLGVRVFNLLPQEAWWPLMATILVLAGCNLFYTVRIRRSPGTRSFLACQGYLDLAVFSVLLHFSGGAGNPLATFMLFHVVIGGILLSRRECYRMAAVGSILFASLAFGEWSGTLAHYPLNLFPETGFAQLGLHLPFVSAAVAVQVTILFLAAYFVTTLSERLRRNENRLSALAERALADRKLLEQALETTSTGLRVLSPDLVPLSVNDRWRDWFGEPGETCVIFPEHPDTGCPAAESLRNGELHVFELERPPGGPGQQVFRIASAPILDARGETNRVVQLAHDITAEKEAHAQMMRAGQMAAVGELAGQVAHEVNNPIAVISAKANLLLKHRRNEMSEKIAEELVKFADLSNRVARIAQGLLSYSRPSPTTRTTIDLCVSIRRSISLIEHRAKHRVIAIEDNLPEDPMLVTANASEIEQVFLNLFINAIQAMPRGGRLTVFALPSETSHCIAVDDTGPGIPEDLRERIFEPFFTTKEENDGTGLGLSICQGLLRSHGGVIEIAESPAGGARFIVRIPLKTPVEPTSKMVSP